MDLFYRNLPTSGPEREALRVRGQFWTPAWIAEAMVGYVLAGGSDTLFDPAVGAGAFFQAAKTVAIEMNKTITLLGAEVDPTAIHQAIQNGLCQSDVANVHITDFIHQPPHQRFQAIVANPPYIRHHRVSNEAKSAVKTIAHQTIGHTIDGRAGLHIYFLLRALQLLDTHGRLAFIMPADTCEGVFAPALWQWITTSYRLEAVVTFEPDASPFPNVDTNPIIFLIKHAAPTTHFLWCRCCRAETHQMKSWMMSDFQTHTSDHIQIIQRNISEALITGLSRPPSTIPEGNLRLADFARVVRGVATGCNDFFFLTEHQASQTGIPHEFLQPAVGRTRDVPANEVTLETIQMLDRKGRPTLLFSPDNRPFEHFPRAVQMYLEIGQKRGIHQRPLLSTRRPWYKMEARHAPPFLFAYLGRRNSRFIRNYANVIPLTVFLCVYPRYDTPIFIDKLWHVLQHPETIAHLALVGKSYGSGAIKVEPRALEKLPLPMHVVTSVFGTTFQHSPHNQETKQFPA